mmetsp:Transcript_14790/g.49141  ORF Transcript_14790/g.49141 Transcript_14790/m.49141 type:complete len:286 (+) Transcript_14790:693-1550(+)
MPSGQEARVPEEDPSPAHGSPRRACASSTVTPSNRASPPSRAAAISIAIRSSHWRTPPRHRHPRSTARSPADRVSSARGTTRPSRAPAWHDRPKAERATHSPAAYKSAPASSSSRAPTAIPARRGSPAPVLTSRCCRTRASRHAHGMFALPVLGGTHPDALARAWTRRAAASAPPWRTRRCSRLSFSLRARSSSRAAAATGPGRPPAGTSGSTACAARSTTSLPPSGPPPTPPAASRPCLLSLRWRLPSIWARAQPIARLASRPASATTRRWPSSPLPTAFQAVV